MAYYLPKDEYAKIMDEINTNYYNAYSGKRFCAHESLGVDKEYYIYYFYNYGFNDYEIVAKVKNRG